MAKAKVVILAGGQGLRMREETEVRPKPMVEVGGKPLLWHIMRQYAGHGFADFVICLGYRGDIIKRYFLDFHFLTSDFTIKLGSGEEAKFHGSIDESDWSVTLAETGLNSETGSRFKQIQKYVRDSDLIMLTYGDGLANVDIQRLVKFHQSHGLVGTVTGVVPPSPFGELKLKDQLVEVFAEKPKHAEGFVNGGFFVFDQRIFDYVLDAPNCSLERDCLKHVAQDGQLMMYRHDGFWQCLDTQRDLVQFQQLWSMGQTPWMSFPELPPREPGSPRTSAAAENSLNFAPPASSSDLIK